MGKKSMAATQEGPLTPLQKGIIGALLSFVPFFIFVLFPIIAHNHILSSMKVSDELLLAVPQPVNMVRTGKIPKTMIFRLRNMEFQVPENYSPVLLSTDNVAFRKLPHEASRIFTFSRLEKTPQINLSGAGFVRWFVPSGLGLFLDTVLYSTWHPAKLLCKAHFLTSQGIEGKFFETSMDPMHKAFIFPAAGGTGYIGRVFQEDGKDYSEIGCLDSLNSVTLREWIDYASLVKFPASPGDAGTYPGANVSMEETMNLAKGGPAQQAQALEISLNRYFALGSSTWVLPILKVLESRGFYREIIDFTRQFSSQEKNDPVSAKNWCDVLDQTAHRILKIDLDPHLQLNKLVGRCQNQGEISIGRVHLNVVLKSPKGEKSFSTILFSQGLLHPGQDQTIEIEPPEEISINNASGVTWHVKDFETGD